eukprot:GILK01006557.1.p1 GENE.GILK01006557.1~~GILK01006557.1.p1  ORF type:complete len:465 (-),score=63.78 GILK01006557.1:93-1487(-)
MEIPEAEREQLEESLLLVGQANKITEDLNLKLHFQAELLSPISFGTKATAGKVIVEKTQLWVKACTTEAWNADVPVASVLYVWRMSEFKRSLKSLADILPTLESHKPALKLKDMRGRVLNAMNCWWITKSSEMAVSTSSSLSVSQRALPLILSMKSLFQRQTKCCISSWKAAASQCHNVCKQTSSPTATAVAGEVAADGGAREHIKNGEAFSGSVNGLMKKFADLQVMYQSYLDAKRDLLTELQNQNIELPPELIQKHLQPLNTSASSKAQSDPHRSLSPSPIKRDRFKLPKQHESAVTKSLNSTSPLPKPRSSLSPPRPSASSSVQLNATWSPPSSKGLYATMTTDSLGHTWGSSRASSPMNRSLADEDRALSFLSTSSYREPSCIRLDRSTPSPPLPYTSPRYLEKKVVSRDESLRGSTDTVSTMSGSTNALRKNSSPVRGSIELPLSIKEKSWAYSLRNSL